jgi:hypothetical protein
MRVVLFDKISSCRHQGACFTPLSLDIDNTTILGVGQAVKPDGSIINETDTMHYGPTIQLIENLQR